MVLKIAYLSRGANREDHRRRRATLQPRPSARATGVRFAAVIALRLVSFRPYGVRSIMMCRLLAGDRHRNPHDAIARDQLHGKTIRPHEPTERRVIDPRVVAHLMDVDFAVLGAIG